MFSSSKDITVNIDPLKRQLPTGLEGVTRRHTSAGEKQSTSAGQDAVLDNINRQNLLERIREIPEARSEVVEIGRRLAEDPNYPSDELVDKLANALADLEPGWLDALGTEEDLGNEPA